MKAGDKVHYQPKYFGDDSENGVIKSINKYVPTLAFVVYNCGDDWENYIDYTGASTRITDLKPGWK